MVIEEIRYEKPVHEASHEGKQKNFIGEEMQADFVDQLASPLDRLAAVVADLIVFVPTVAVFIAPFRRQALMSQLLNREDEWVLALSLVAFGSALAWILYQTASVSLFGGTLGKRVMGLRVVAIWDGAKPRPLMAFLRSLVWCLEVLALGIPWLALYANERRRSFHDRVSDTAVIAVKKRAAGPPTIPEMGIASGLSAAGVVVLGTVLTTSILKLQPSLQGANEAAAAFEESGLLCSTVGEARKAWTVRSGGMPSRLSVALALFATEVIDENCLRGESELALWRNEDKELAYLGKAMAEAGEDGLYESYLDRVCEMNESSNECRLVHFLRLEREAGVEPTESDDKSHQVEIDAQLGDLVASFEELGAETPVYLRVWVIRYLMEQGQFESALKWLLDSAPEKRVGFYYVRERSKALWNLGRKNEARTALHASFDTLETNERIDIASWFCSHETIDQGCNDGSRRVCEMLNATVDASAHSEHYLASPAIAVAYLRGETCRGSLSSERIEYLSQKIPNREAKSYLEALLLLKEPKKKKALGKLRSLASGRDQQGEFFVEANIRLVDLAATEEDLKKVKKTWLGLSPDDGWWQLGRRLMDRGLGLQAWDQALEVGMKMIAENRYDVSLRQQMVVAAYRAGNQRLALGLLESLEEQEVRLSADRSAERSDRSPASVSAFQEVARELLGERGEGL